MKKIVLFALAAIVSLPLLAQTNKEAIKAAENQVAQKQKELAAAQQRHEQNTREANQQIDILSKQADLAKIQY
ncbi:MAG: hypothetical protein II763_04360, partial [Bacteroidales bacterium]|nr:hypothetical protein [Bacteroidales bacterium]